LGETKKEVKGAETDRYKSIAQDEFNMQN